MIDNSFWNGKRVLVTGHNGFKGSWLCVWLIKMGAEVYGYSLADTPNGLYSSMPEIQKSVVERIGDICDHDLLCDFIKTVEPEVVFHLAAQALVLDGYRDPLFTWKTNTIGSLNVLECIRKVGLSCVAVMITTDKVYENQEWEYGYRENDRLGGKDPYSASKATAELAI